MEDGVFFREVLCSGKTLKVKQLYIGDVGCVVWDAALVLCRFDCIFLISEITKCISDSWRTSSIFPGSFGAGRVLWSSGPVPGWLDLPLETWGE